MNITVRWDDKKQVVVISQLVKDLASLSSKDLSQIGQKWIDYSLDPRTQENLSNKILRRRTGHLAGSAHWEAKKAGKGTVLTLKSAVYGPIHEFGGTISPKRASFLAVPLPPVMTPAGVARGRPRDFPGTFVARSRSGNLIIFQKAGKDRIVPLFVLKKKVTIPARHWASQSVEESMKDFDAIVDSVFGGKGE